MPGPSRVLRAATCSRRGPGRAASSDLGIARPDLGFFLLADGDGEGTPADVAAAAAVRGAERALLSAEPATCEVRAEGAVIAANLELWRVSTSQTAYPRMGATFGALVVAGQHGAFVGVGNVALFRWRARSLERIVCGPGVAHARLGHAPSLALEPLELDLCVGDVLLLASDGVHSALLRSTDLSAALAQPEPRLAAEYVVAAALDRGGMDDATALVVRIDADA